MTTLTRRQSRMLAHAAQRGTPATVLMSEDEARQAVTAYRDSMARAEAHLTSARAMLLDLHDREGWRALGYPNWRECAVAELGLSQAHVYRLLIAAEIERDIRPVLIDFSHDEKNLPETVLRPIAQLETVEERQAAARSAIESAGGGVPTAPQMRQAVDDTATFTDAAQRFAALGWRLERHGLWFKLTDDDGNHYATTQDLAPQLATLATFEAGAARRVDAPLIVGQRADPNKPDPKEPPLPSAPDGWVIWQNEGETTIGLQHVSGHKLVGQDAAALIAEAESVGRYLTELHEGGWRVSYDPMCPPTLNAYTATHQHLPPIAAKELPRLALLAWRANLFEDDLPDWPDDLIDGLYLAGEDVLDLAKQGFPLGRLYHLAGIAQPTAPAVRACEECGAPATNKQNIGGVSAHRCGPCTEAAFAQEQADQAAVTPRAVAPTPAAPRGRSDWWNCGRELKAFDHALNSGDQLRAARAAFTLGIAVAGDATRLAFAQAERGAELLEAEGLASLASVIRLLLVESEAAV